METNKIYKNGKYLNNNPTWHEEDSLWKANQIMRLLKKNNIKPKTICEVGCGAGEILNSLCDNLSENVLFFGYEISPQAYAICSKKKKENLNFFLKDFTQEKDTFFDVILLIDVLEHIEDCFGFIRNLRAKGCYKVFHIPLDMSVQAVLRSTPIMSSRLNFGHIHYFNKETALATLRETGYEIIDYSYTKWFSELQSRNWKANLMKIPRKLLFSIHKDLTVRILGGFSLLVLTK